MKKSEKKDYLMPQKPSRAGHSAADSIDGQSSKKSLPKLPKVVVPKPEEPYNFTKELFKLFDHDGSFRAFTAVGKEYIDISEVKRLLGIFKSSMPSAMASRIIAEVDANGDGKIDFQGEGSLKKSRI